MPEIGTISTYRSGVDVVVEWKIKNFFTLSTSHDGGCWSPEFSFVGKEWHFWIYPNEWSGNDSSGHVDLMLVKYSSGPSIKQPFSLSLKTVRGEKYNEQHFLKDFDNYTLFHRFNRFIQNSELSRRRSELVPEGTLTVICTMKSSTSAGSGSNSDFAEHSSDSGECCRKCSDCLDIVKKQKKLLEELESQKEISEGARSLSEDYKKVLFGGHDHNLILKVGDKELRAHRDILRARSRVFESMLDHDMKEKNTGIIDVPDCNPNAMELFLSYVYCGKIEALDHNSMLGLYYIADKYEMMELKRECCNFIKKSLSLINICSVIQLALNHSDSDLLEYATGYFSDNMLDIMQTVEWQSFLKDHSTVGNELLMKCFKKLKKAQT